MAAMLNNHKCTICNNTGKLYPLNSNGSVNFQKLVTCSCVLNDLAAERTKSFLQSSGIGALGRYNFDLLNTEDKGLNPLYSAALKKAQAWIVQPIGWLFLSGSYGPSKSHISAALTMEALKQNKSAAYRTALEIIALLRIPLDEETVFSKSIDFVRSSHLLIIDEIHPELSDWEQERLGELLAHRLRNDLPCVLASASPPQEYNPSLSAKFSDSALCQICDLGETIADQDRDSGFDTRFALQKKMTFASFQKERPNLPKEQSFSLKSAFIAATSFAEHPEGWLIFIGGVGSGKTHLAAAIANAIYEKGGRCLFASVPELVDSLRQAYSNTTADSMGYDQLLNRIKTTPLLILDDFGGEVVTPWAKEKLYQIISYRHNAQLPMVLTSNLSLDEIGKRDERVLSRLLDKQMSNVLAVTANDFRIHGTAYKK